MEADQADAAEKTRATFHLPKVLMDEIRDTVVALSGPPERMTMASFAEGAFARELERLRELRPGKDRGESFPPRGAPVRTGRPIT